MLIIKWITGEKARAEKAWRRWHKNIHAKCEHKGDGMLCKHPEHPGNKPQAFPHYPHCIYQECPKNLGMPLTKDC
jgi:hypothetical protein